MNLVDRVSDADASWGLHQVRAHRTWVPDGKLARRILTVAYGVRVRLCEESQIMCQHEETGQVKLTRHCHKS
jgi:hypothetical protein